jgi:hypothetical protein
MFAVERVAHWAVNYDARPTLPQAGAPDNPRRPETAESTHTHTHTHILVAASILPYDAVAVNPGYSITTKHMDYKITLTSVAAGDRIPVGARFSAPVQTGPGTHPASYVMDTESISRA